MLVLAVSTFSSFLYVPAQVSAIVKLTALSFGRGFGAHSRMLAKPCSKFSVGKD